MIIPAGKSLINYFLKNVAQKSGLILKMEIGGADFY